MFTFVDYEASTYGYYLYPVWADVVGWLLAVFAISPIFVFFFLALAKGDAEDSALEVGEY